MLLCGYCMLLSLRLSCVHLHASLYLCSHWMTVMDNLGEKLYSSSSNHAFPCLVIFYPLTHWESVECGSRWLYCPLARPGKDLGCSTLQVIRSNAGWPIAKSKEGCLQFLSQLFFNLELWRWETLSASICTGWCSPSLPFWWLLTFREAEREQERDTRGMWQKQRQCLSTI